MPASDSGCVPHSSLAALFSLPIVMRVATRQILTVFGCRTVACPAIWNGRFVERRARVIRQRTRVTTLLYDVFHPQRLILAVWVWITAERTHNAQTEFLSPAVFKKDRQQQDHCEKRRDESVSRECLACCTSALFGGGR